MNLSGMAEVIHHRLHRGVIGNIPGGTRGESDIRGVNGTVQHSAAGQLQGCTALSNDIRGDGKFTNSGSNTDAFCKLQILTTKFMRMVFTFFYWLKLFCLVNHL